MSQIIVINVKKRSNRESETWRKSENIIYRIELFHSASLLKWFAWREGMVDVFLHFIDEGKSPINYKKKICIF